jgi:hypothetical protein
MRSAAAASLFVLAACSSEASRGEPCLGEEPEGKGSTVSQLVVVDSCYTSTGEFTMTINGQSVKIEPVSKRNDTVAVCAWEQIDLSEKIEVVLSGSVDFKATLPREDGKALVVSVTLPVDVAFLDEERLAYD